MEARKVKLDRRTAADLGVDFHVTEGLLDEPMHLTEPQAGATARRLCGEERIECLFYRLGRHAGAGVRHGNEDVLAGRHSDMLCGVGIVEVGIGGLDGQAAPLLHRIARIDREIDNCSFELRGVGVDTPEPARKHRLHSDRLSKGTTQ